MVQVFRSEWGNFFFGGGEASSFFFFFRAQSKKTLASPPTGLSTLIQHLNRSFHWLSRVLYVLLLCSLVAVASQLNQVLAFLFPSRFS